MYKGKGMLGVIEYHCCLPLPIINFFCETRSPFRWYELWRQNRDKFCRSEASYCSFSYSVFQAPRSFLFFLAAALHATNGHRRSSRDSFDLLRSFRLDYPPIRPHTPHPRFSLHFLIPSSFLSPSPPSS